jgi:hypothetical protein
LVIFVLLLILNVVLDDGRRPVLRAVGAAVIYGAFLVAIDRIFRPDGPLARWWRRSGPSKNPDDYR